MNELVVANRATEWLRSTRKKNCYLRPSFTAKRANRVFRKAFVATAHRPLLIAFCILRDGTEYRELGDNYFDQLHPERTRTRLVRRLERIGLDVSLSPRTEQSIPRPEPSSASPKRGRPCKCFERAIPCKHGI